jgi:hypothetical protein
MILPPFHAHLGFSNEKNYICCHLLMMYEALIKYFNSYTTTPLNEDEVNVIESVLEPKKIRKRPE